MNNPRLHKHHIAYNGFKFILSQSKFKDKWISDETIICKINTSYPMLQGIGGIGRCDLNKALGTKGVQEFSNYFINYCYLILLIFI